MTTDVQKYDIANTLASTDENQNESVKVKVSAPINPAAMMVHIRSVVISSPFGTTSFLASMVMVQKRNRMANALLNTEIIFIITATLPVSPKAKSESTRAASWKVGAPGG